MTSNRPYLFELTALLRTTRQNNEDETNLREAATHNRIDLKELDRVAAIVDALAADGIDLDEWVRREYIIDGWLRGWLSPQTSLDDPSLTTWKLSQFADEHYLAKGDA